MKGHDPRLGVLVPEGQEKTRTPKSTICLRNHFLFASNDPMMSLRNSSLKDKSDYVFYQAVRLKEDIKVKGVRVIDPVIFEAFQKKTKEQQKKGVSPKRFTTKEKLMPAGSLLLKPLSTNKTLMARRGWYGLTPEEMEHQNLMRVGTSQGFNKNKLLEAGDVVDVDFVSSLHSLFNQKALMEEFWEPKSSYWKTHVEDINWLRKAADKKAKLFISYKGEKSEEEKGLDGNELTA